MTNDNSAIQTLLDKQALHELMTAYARGVDRADVAVLESIWHDDATVDVGMFVGSAKDFCAAMTAPGSPMETCSHMIMNEFYHVDGDTAVGESYVLGMTTTVNEDGSKTDASVGGRYLDRYSRRDGVWKIDHHQFVVDFNRSEPCSAIWEEGSMFAMMTRGTRDSSDSLYALLKG